MSDDLLLRFVSFHLPDIRCRYLNPNLISLATNTPYSRGTTNLSVYVIDAVKGHVITKAVHDGVFGAVHIAQAENWVAYHFRSRRAKRYVLNYLSTSTKS